MSQAEIWIKDALMAKQANAQLGLQGTASIVPPRSQNLNPDSTLVETTPVTQAQVLLVALMSTGLAAASVAQIHSTLLAWLRCVAICFVF